MKTIALRLKPDEDLKLKIQELCESNKISAACVMSSVGSLKKLRLRLADSKGLLEQNEKFEILSLNGTASNHGVHLHMAVSDGAGKVWGGHLMDGNLIYTTCELVLVEIENLNFFREHDPNTGFKELVIK